MPRSLTPSVSSSADLSSVLALDNIRQTLIRQEDTIIFLLIERAQFARNAAVYKTDAVPVPDFDSAGQRYSLLEYLLRETEQVHGRIRRYTSPDEQPFYPDRIPPLVLPPIEYAQVRADASHMHVPCLVIDFSGPARKPCVIKLLDSECKAHSNICKI